MSGLRRAQSTDPISAEARSRGGPPNPTLADLTPRLSLPCEPEAAHAPTTLVTMAHTGSREVLHRVQGENGRAPCPTDERLAICDAELALSPFRGDGLVDQSGEIRVS